MDTRSYGKMKVKTIKTILHFTSIFAGRQAGSVED